jgi:hypothetical protein
MDLQTASSNGRALRRSLRRAVQLEVEVMSDLWHGAVPLLATNLSLHGAWLESELALCIGDELSVAFEPPQWSGLPRLQTHATVARVSLLRRRRDSGPAGMGLCFDELSTSTLRCLDYSLRGLPPPLPANRDGIDPPRDFDESPAVLQLDDGNSYLFCAEAALLSAGRPRVQASQATQLPAPCKHFWFERRTIACSVRSPMTAIFEQRRAHFNSTRESTREATTRARQACASSSRS